MGGDKNLVSPMHPAPGSRGDTIVLHQLSRGRFAPNISPFPIKLETFFRMVKIPYVSDFSKPLSRKGKTPWMTFNGEEVADSQFCIEYLVKSLGKDLSAHLSDSERALERGLRCMLEDNFYFCLAMDRWLTHDLDHIKEMFGNLPGPSLLGPIIIRVIRRNVLKQCHAQGIGRHTMDEIAFLGRQDLEAVSNFLGDKHYLFGDEATVADCTLFGFSVQILFNSSSDNRFRHAVEEDFPNLKRHCLRIKATYWPDWDACLLT